ncbi:ABC transporter substrate-binding protein [Streptomyces olivaceus]|uniref:ABC transporter substrate-binding protein n=1 Tax=Streptomyces olivaceus TaxID=47716 RepID=UPI0033A64A79
MRGIRDRRTWRWLPRRLRFRVLGLVDVVVLWTLVAALTTAGAWWGLDSYRHHRDYCTANRDLRRVGQECIGVTAEAYSFDSDLGDILGRIEDENEAARTSGKPVVSVAVVMPYTAQSPGAAMSQELIQHSLQGAYVAQQAHNHGPATGDTAVQLLFANVGEDLSHWETVTDALAARRGGDAPVVAAIGFPNSDDATLAAVREGLRPARIPAVSAVLSSRDMEDPYLFKVSPSTDQFVDALQRYVSANEVDRKNAFMIADDRDDNYVYNLREAFRIEFGEQYGINPDEVERPTETYTGIKGPDQGTPQIFRRAVAAMCAVDAHTVFLAGRDADLPPFLETIDRTSSCNQGSDADPLRILRVSTGRAPETESDEMRRIAESNNIEIVTAVAVDAPRWRDGADGDEQVPTAFARFAASYDQHFDENSDTGALDDGYAVMYHDALTAVGTAVAAARDNEIDAVTHNDVYDELRRGSPREHCAATCVQGASGVFTFADESAGAEAGEGSERVDGLWPVCKPVPMVTFPVERRDKSPLYRTYQVPGKNTCPAP